MSATNAKTDGGKCIRIDPGLPSHRLDGGDDIVRFIRSIFGGGDHVRSAMGYQAVQAYPFALWGKVGIITITLRCASIRRWTFNRARDDSGIRSLSLVGSSLRSVERGEVERHGEYRSKESGGKQTREDARHLEEYKWLKTRGISKG